VSLIAAIIIACILLLGLWFFDRSIENRKKVLACTHENVQVQQIRPEYGGTLYLQCKCGYQAHLRLLRPLPDGTWWLMQGKDFKEAEINYFNAYNERKRQSKSLPD